jgi:hypothetical protein
VLALAGIFAREYWLSIVQDSRIGFVLTIFVVLVFVVTDAGALLGTGGQPETYGWEVLLGGIGSGFGVGRVMYVILQAVRQERRKEVAEDDQRRRAELRRGAKQERRRK